MYIQRARCGRKKGEGVDGGDSIGSMVFQYKHSTPPKKKKKKEKEKKKQRKHKGCI